MVQHLLKRVYRHMLQVCQQSLNVKLGTWKETWSFQSYFSFETLADDGWGAFAGRYPWPSMHNFLPYFLILSHIDHLPSIFFLSQLDCVLEQGSSRGGTCWDGSEVMAGFFLSPADSHCKDQAFPSFHHPMQDHSVAYSLLSSLELTPRKVYIGLQPMNTIFTQVNTIFTQI